MNELTKLFTNLQRKKTICRQLHTVILLIALLETIYKLISAIINFRITYSIDFHPFEGNESVQILDNEHLSVQTIPMNHGIPCCGFLFKEKAKRLV